MTISQGQSDFFDIDACLSWLFTFDAMVMIDKERRWLVDVDDSSSTSVIHLLTFPVKIIRYCSVVIDDPPCTNSDKRNVSSSEIILFSECICNSMRVIMNTLKNRKTAPSPSPGYTAMWTKLACDLFFAGSAVLNSSLVNRDTLTSTGT
jgi:hypothetical protein